MLAFAYTLRTSAGVLHSPAARSVTMQRRISLLYVRNATNERTCERRGVSRFKESVLALSRLSWKWKMASFR